MKDQLSFTSDCIEGTSLDRLAKALDARQAALLVQKVAEASQYAHDQGIVHRDVKPAKGSTGFGW